MRLSWVRLQLAAGTVPDLGALAAEPLRVTVRELACQYLDTRIDASPATLQVYRQAFAHLGALGGLEPGAVRVVDVQAWVISTAGVLAAATVRKYLDAVRQVLDFADIHPNPARSRRVRLPAMPSGELNPPSTAHVAAILEFVPAKYRLQLRVLDWSGVRLGELQRLTWGDVDWREARLRIARGRTKGRTAGRRFVPLPTDLLAEVGDLLPLEDRDPQQPIWPALSDQGLRLALARACKVAGVPHYSPHDLRHRYISLLVMAGTPLPLVREVVGHSRASVTLDVYSHVLLDEPAMVLETRRRLVERRPGDVPVTYRTTPQDDESPADAGLSREVEDTGIEPVTFALPARRSPS